MAPQSPKPSEQLHILYVEDDPTDAGFVQVTLEQEGFSCNIELVDNRQDFVEALEKDGYDMIFADFVLPSFDGLTALSIAQEKCPDTPFIIISAYIGEDNAIECLKCGATDCISKLRLSKLVPAVRRAQKEIEERKKRQEAEQLLLKNEQRYRTLFDLSPSGILLEDINGNIIDVNQAFCHSCGYSQDELVGNNVRLFVPPESVDDVAQHISLILTQGTLEHEVTNVRKDGTLCHMKLREKKVMLPDGQYGILVVANDVTLRKRAEEGLRKSEADLKTIFENSVQSFLAIDRERTIRVFNSSAGNQAQSMFGKKMEQGDSVYSFLRGSDVAQFNDYLDQALNGEHVMVEREFKGVGNGNHWFEIHYAPITKDDGPIDGVLLTALDITERRQSEEALRESEARFRTIFEMAGAGIALASPEGKFLQVNPFICKLLGYSSEELKELTDTDITHPDDLEETRLAVSRTMERHQNSIALEKRYVTQNGSIVWAQTITGWIFDTDEKPIYSVAVILDVTERKHAEQALREGEERYRIVAERQANSCTITTLHRDKSRGLAPFCKSPDTHLKSLRT